MKLKVSSKHGYSLKSKLGLPAVILLAASFFVAGFFFSSVLFQHASGPPHGPRMLEAVDEERPVMPYGETGDHSFTSIPFQVLSWAPRALYFPNFSPAEHCQSIIEMTKSALQPSTLAFRKGETADTTKGIRTSSGMFISASEDKTGVLDIVEEKIARVTMLPRTHGEAFNVLRYEVGQRYNSHYDAFNPAEYGPQKSQRVASFLLYLSDVEEGGETMFPFESGVNMDVSYDFRKCTGLKVKPRRGDGLLFYSLLPNGTIDPFPLEFFGMLGGSGFLGPPKYALSHYRPGRKATFHGQTGAKLGPSNDSTHTIFFLTWLLDWINEMQTSIHGSCPVIKGEKWVATKWIRDQEPDDE